LRLHNYRDFGGVGRDRVLNRGESSLERPRLSIETYVAVCFVEQGQRAPRVGCSFFVDRSRVQDASRRCLLPVGATNVATANHQEGDGTADNQAPGEQTQGECIDWPGRGKLVRGLHRVRGERGEVWMRSLLAS
jgi:hypothetical protein